LDTDARISSMDRPSQTPRLQLFPDWIGVGGPSVGTEAPPHGNKVGEGHDTRHTTIRLMHDTTEIPPDPASNNATTNIQKHRSLENNGKPWTAQGPKPKAATMEPIITSPNKQNERKSCGFSLATEVSHIGCSSFFVSQMQTRVKLKRVFFPRKFFQVRSLGCEFTCTSIGTEKTSLIHSCTSQIK